MLKFGRTISAQRCFDDRSKAELSSGESSALNSGSNLAKATSGAVEVSSANGAKPQSSANPNWAGGRKEAASMLQSRGPVLVSIGIEWLGALPICPAADAVDALCDR